MEITDMIYLIGSLRNPQIPTIANKLREGTKQEVFDSWYSAGEFADDAWRDHEKLKGNSYMEALKGYAARNVFEFDKKHLDRADGVVLALPAGKSGHLELGYTLGRGKWGYILLDDPERWDVMYQFATGIFTNIEELIHVIKSSTDQLGKISSQNLGVCAHARWHSSLGYCLDCL
jgi:hypothetical protein